MKNRRREGRYPFESPCAVRCGKRRIELVIDNVSYSGVFVRSEAPLPLRQLVVLELDLPVLGKLEVHAMVVYLVSSGGSGAPPGIGLQLYGLSKQEQERWMTFVGRLSRQTPAVSEAVAQPAQPARRARPTRQLVLKLRPRTRDELLEVWAREIERGELFIETDQPLRIGSRIGIEVVHPDTEDLFELPSVVRRHELVGTRPGVVLAVSDLDASMRGAFRQFAYVGAPVVGR